MNLIPSRTKEDGPGNFPPWHRLTPPQRHREMVRYAHRHHGYAVSLNMKPEFADYLRSKEKPMRIVGKRMNAELNRLDLRQMPVLLVLEATRPAGCLHLHGVYLDRGTPKLRIQEAMRKAVGHISGRAGSRQFIAKSVYAADGWHNYIWKDRGWTRRLLDLAADENLWWVSQVMTRTVSEDYETIRLGRRTAANSNGPQITAA